MLQLQKSGINMISEELKNSIPKFEDGEVKVFQMLNGIQNSDPDQVERAKSPILYGHSQIPTQDKIKDPFTNEHVVIAVVEDFAVETGALIKSKLFVPGMNERKFYGKFTLTEGDEELYEFLYLCNFNRDNPNRNKKVEPLFYEIKKPSFTNTGATEAIKKAQPVLMSKKEATSKQAELV